MKNTLFIGVLSAAAQVTRKPHRKKYNLSLPHHKIGLGSLAKVLAGFSLSICSSTQAAMVGINEIHYDNIGADTGEGIELVGVSGFSLNNWSLVFYNGSDGRSYKTVSLAESIPTTETPESEHAINFLHISVQGLQNGPADGVALVNDTGEVLSFLSYEGVVSATNGPATGLSSLEIPLTQDGSTENNITLQRTADVRWDGSSLFFSDSDWTHGVASWGTANIGQSLIIDSSITAVPLPPGIALLAGALSIGSVLTHKRRKLRR